ncbi:hypothetical protein Bbelb_404780 [Branchiostoma belcheri]|nr:hypothetical protein Bbelb_404780 [Branchiostoma belcheri]
MERSLREGTDPSEAEICEANSTHRRTGPPNKWREMTDNNPTKSTIPVITRPTNAKHRKKMEQTHKRIVLLGEHHSKFKHSHWENCGTSNYVCVSEKAAEATTTCKTAMKKCPGFIPNLDATRQKSSKIASRHKLAAILDIVGNVRYRRRARSVASRLPKPDRKLSDYNRKGYRAFPTAVADIPDYIQDGRQLVPTSYFTTFLSRCGIFRLI